MDSFNYLFDRGQAGKTVFNVEHAESSFQLLSTVVLKSMVVERDQVRGDIQSGNLPTEPEIPGDNIKPAAFCITHNTPPGGDL